MADGKALSITSAANDAFLKGLRLHRRFGYARENDAASRTEYHVGTAEHLCRHVGAALIAGIFRR